MWPATSKVAKTDCTIIKKSPPVTGGWGAAEGEVRAEHAPWGTPGSPVNVGVTKQK